MWQHSVEVAMPIEFDRYETLRTELMGLPRPKSDGDRLTYWVVDRVLGIAKTSIGAIELFLVGDKVIASSNLVRRHLEHDLWEISEDQSKVMANRIVLPADPHFLPLAALIAVELVNCGLSDARSLPEAFKSVEPLIELALRRSVLAEEHIVGLIGELLCLEVMLDAVSDLPTHRSSVLDMWRGHLGGLRDFVIGDTAIEVKTTQGQSSSHVFSGLHQVEPSSATGLLEKDLLLLSIGLSRGGAEGQSLAELVERISSKLIPVPIASPGELGTLQKRFLADVASYGSDSSNGYDHGTMADLGIYRLRFCTTFSPRLYDMVDSDFRILRKSDLAGTYVSPNDLKFRLDLEPIINASNPVSNWTQVVSRIVRAAL
jgi:hypothetical protein